MNPKEYYEFIRNAYEQAGKPEIAEGQRAYMRHQFDYFGLKAPMWVGILKPLMREHGLLEGDHLRQFVHLCFLDEHREMHYTGLQMVEKAQKYEDDKLIYLLGELIETHSWWDTVDWLAKLVGIYFKKHTEMRDEITGQWIAHNNMWLKRVAIIFQLRYNMDTDKDLLAKYILICQDSKEFFIQKAMGWALRQYAKWNAPFVIQFVKDNPQLPPLTKREALRLVNKRSK